MIAARRRQGRGARLRRRDPAGRRSSRQIDDPRRRRPTSLLVTLVAVALLRGSIVGAAARLLRPACSSTPANLGTLGVTSLLLTIAGYWIGRYGETTGARPRARAVRLGRGRDRPRTSSARSSCTTCSATRLRRAVVLLEHAAADGRAEPAADAAGLRARPRGCSPLDRPRARDGGAAAWLARAAHAAARAAFLPPDPRVEEPYRFTPQLALRVAILGAIALAVFGVLFFRLWALQVLSGPQYLQAALEQPAPLDPRRGAARRRSSTATAASLVDERRRHRRRAAGRPTCRRPDAARYASCGGSRRSCTSR